MAALCCPAWSDVEAPGPRVLPWLLRDRPCTSPFSWCGSGGQPLMASSRRGRAPSVARSVSPWEHRTGHRAGTHDPACRMFPGDRAGPPAPPVPSPIPPSARHEAPRGPGWKQRRCQAPPACPPWATLPPGFIVEPGRCWQNLFSGQLQGATLLRGTRVTTRETTRVRLTPRVGRRRWRGSPVTKTFRVGRAGRRAWCSRMSTNECLSPRSIRATLSRWRAKRAPYRGTDSLAHPHDGLLRRG
jgi:hypothetical protein